MNIQELIEETIESINTLTKFVKTHQSTSVSYDDLDELEKATADLQEVTYELEARVSSEEDDNEELSYEEL